MLEWCHWATISPNALFNSAVKKLTGDCSRKYKNYVKKKPIESSNLVIVLLNKIQNYAPKSNFQLKEFGKHLTML
jgi:hypothetical protein